MKKSWLSAYKIKFKTSANNYYKDIRIQYQLCLTDTIEVATLPTTPKYKQG